MKLIDNLYLYLQSYSFEKAAQGRKFINMLLLSSSNAFSLFELLKLISVHLVCNKELLSVSTSHCAELLSINYHVNYICRTVFHSHLIEEAVWSHISSFSHPPNFQNFDCY